MLRRSLLVLPMVAALAGWFGASTGRVAPAVGLAVLAAFVAELTLARVGERRVERVAAAVEGYAAGDRPVALPQRGSAAWRRLGRALTALGEELAERFRKLDQERTRVERLLEHLAPGVLLFTPDGLAYANAAARRLFVLDDASSGRSPIQVLGVRAFADAVKEADERGTEVEVEIEHERGYLAARAGVTAEGEVALVVTDLTEQRRVEAMRRDFVVNASHELKTPAAAMQALGESLELALAKDPERALRMVDQLQQEAARLGSLVRELLDLARLEEGLARSYEPVDLAAMARVQADRLRGKAAERDVTLSLDCPEPAVVVGLREDLRLLIDNLVSNAIAYNRPGGEVRVAVHKRPGSVLLEVADTGIGIAESDLTRIFERFYRVDQARSRADGGTGLGLAIVRHAVQSHGGEIAVDSVLGRGSTFHVTLPVEGAAFDARGAGTAAR